MSNVIHEVAMIKIRLAHYFILRILITHKQDAKALLEKLTNVCISTPL
jgi:hypothetical protein